jgi:hypothetical protein
MTARQHEVQRSVVSAVFSPRGKPVITRGCKDMGANSSIDYCPDADTLIVVPTHAGDAGPERSWSRAVPRKLEEVLGL